MTALYKSSCHSCESLRTTRFSPDSRRHWRGAFPSRCHTCSDTCTCCCHWIHVSGMQRVLRVCPKFKCEPGPINNSGSARGRAGADRWGSSFFKDKELIFYFSERLGEQSKWLCSNQSTSGLPIVGRKMGFSPPLLYFLTSSLYLNLIWVKNFKKAILMIFICTVLILFHLFSSNQKKPSRASCIFSIFGWRKQWQSWDWWPDQLI